MMDNIILLVRNLEYLNNIDYYGNLGEKLFDTVEDVVADGLITLFMEKHNADKYLQNQRSSLVTIHNNLGGKSPSHSNGVPLVNEGSWPTLTTIAEQDAICEIDDQVKGKFPLPNGYGIDPLATLPRFLPIVDPLKSPDDESSVSDSQVYPCILLIYSCISLYLLVYIILLCILFCRLLAYC